MKDLKLILPKYLDMCKIFEYFKVRNFCETNCRQLKKISKYKELNYPKIKNNLRKITRLDAKTQKTSRTRNKLNQMKLDTQMSNE